MDQILSGGLTRRALLERLGRVGGTAAVFAAMNAFGVPMASAIEAPPDLRGSGKGKKVVVLGAGHAGNTSALELSKLGYEVTVLEARSFAGGRAQSARKGFTAQELGDQALTCTFDEGQYINIGPWRIPYWHRSTLYYARTLGVPLEILVNDNDAAFVMAKDVKGGLAGKRVRQAEIKADARGYTAELVAKAANSGKLDGLLSAEDKQIFVEYMRHEGYLKKDLSYKGTDGRGWVVNPGAGLDPGPGKEAELFGFSDVLNSELWKYFASVTNHEMQWTMFQPVGGMDQIARGFERHMGHLIKFNMEVEQIRQSDRGVTVSCLDTKSGKRSQVTADYMVCTIPLPVLHQLDTDFSDEFKEAITGVSYALVNKTGLQMKRRFWEEDYGIYGGHIKTLKNGSFGNYLISLPSTGYASQKGVLLGAYIHGADAAEFSAKSFKERVEYCLDVGETVFPGQYRSNFDSAFSWCWHKAKYNLGGWAQWSEEGRKTAYPKLLEPQGRIYLAGEHLSYLTGWQAGAIESAWQQIAKLHQHAMQA